jgi:hypothetical protein
MFSLFGKSPPIGRELNHRPPRVGADHSTRPTEVALRLVAIAICAHHTSSPICPLQRRSGHEGFDRVVFDCGKIVNKSLSLSATDLINPRGSQRADRAVGGSTRGQDRLVHPPQLPSAARHACIHSCTDRRQEIGYGDEPSVLSDARSQPCPHNPNSVDRKRLSAAEELSRQPTPR